MPQGTSMTHSLDTKCDIKAKRWEMERARGTNEAAAPVAVQAGIAKQNICISSYDISIKVR